MPQVTPHDGLVNLISHLKGNVVVVQMVDGSAVEGLLFEFDAKKGKGDISLRLAQKIDQQAKTKGIRNTNPFEDVKVIKADQYLTMKVAQVQQDSRAKAGFATDAQIGVKKTMDALAYAKERDTRLQKWGADDDATFGGLESSDTGSGVGGWDQFSAPANVKQRLRSNQKDFDLDDYSTALDKSSEFYKRQEKEAAKIAKAILSGSSENVHVAMERGQMIDGLDEDALHSTVLSSNSSNPARDSSKYVPPALRKKLSNQENQSKATADTGKTESSAAPADSSEEADKKKTEEKPKSKLNPNAKPFTLNANAKAFVPSFEAPAAAAPAPAAFGNSAPTPQMWSGQPQQAMYPQQQMAGAVMYPAGMAQPGQPQYFAVQQSVQPQAQPILAGSPVMSGLVGMQPMPLTAVPHGQMQMVGIPRGSGSSPGGNPVMQQQQVQARQAEARTRAAIYNAQNINPMMQPNAMSGQMGGSPMQTRQQPSPQQFAGPQSPPQIMFQQQQQQQQQPLQQASPQHPSMFQPVYHSQNQMAASPSPSNGNPQIMYSSQTQNRGAAQGR
mmetsp:Transcript_9947/g.14476  ORF Transcript_9947/g.14476 Transcript_9947/m.14476 type:complete len:556 (+) Transcript_9947:62-1729(+)